MNYRPRDSIKYKNINLHTAGLLDKGELHSCLHRPRVNTTSLISINFFDSESTLMWLKFPIFLFCFILHVYTFFYPVSIVDTRWDDTVDAFATMMCQSSTMCSNRAVGCFVQSLKLSNQDFIHIVYPLLYLAE